MGTDKALLSSADGSTWLSSIVHRLIGLSLPTLVVSGHASHAELLQNYRQVNVLREPRPWKGPLKAFSHVLSAEPGHPLLVLPVDMPCLTTAVIQDLIVAWQQQPARAAVAHDGERCQPLFGIYPSGSPFQPALIDRLHKGDFRWHRWLGDVPHRSVALPSHALLNANRPEDLAALKA